MRKRTKIIVFITVFITILLLGVALKIFAFPSVKFELIGEKFILLSYGNEYQEEGVVAKVNGKDYSKKVKIDAKELDTSKVGEYKIGYSLDIYGKKKKKTRIVKIVDNVEPKIELINGNNINLDYGANYIDPGYNVSDNYDDKDSLKVKVTYDKEINTQQSGEYKITYEVIDTSGNSTKEVRVVTVREQERIINIDGITYVDGILIANKIYSLPSSYNPGVNSEAYNQLVNLQNDASSLGYSIPLLSGFRTYDYQRQIYNNYVSIYGVEKTDTFSARPGTSEHQTGLAFDVGALDDNYGDTQEGFWLSKNAHRYGFIIRYPQGKQHITGYKYEPWHIRYLGVDVATKVYNSGLTLEEYLGI